MERNVIEFKAIVSGPLAGDGYHHLWGYTGRNKPLAGLGSVVLVRKWTLEDEVLYRVYSGRNMFQLSEERAKACLRAMRRPDRTLVPLTEAEAQDIADAEEHFQIQMSR